MPRKFEKVKKNTSIQISKCLKMLENKIGNENDKENKRK